MKTGYKVVHLKRAGRGRRTIRWSSAVLDSDGRAYALNRATRPHKKGGPLCLFTTEEAARAYVDWLVGQPPDKSYDDYEIYLCRYEPSNDLYLKYPSIGWKESLPRYLASLPRPGSWSGGVALATSITLTERLAT